MGGGFISVVVGVGEHVRQSEDCFACFGKGLAREISCETGGRRGKARSQSSQQKKGVSNSQGKATVRERRLPSEELGPVDPEARSASARG